MRAVVQRVWQASVRVEGRVVGHIGRGLLVLLGVASIDTVADADWVAEKLLGLRVFPGVGGEFDASVSDIDGAILVVSQFTLYGDVRKGRRPSVTDAAGSEQADALYQREQARIAAQGIAVQSGCFGAHMHVHLVNDGPVTLCIESAPRGQAAATGQ